MIADGECEKAPACAKETEKEIFGGSGCGHSPPASHCHKSIAHNQNLSSHTKLA